MTVRIGMQHATRNAQRTAHNTQARHIHLAVAATCTNLPVLKISAEAEPFDDGLLACHIPAGNSHAGHARATCMLRARSGGR